MAPVPGIRTLVCIGCRRELEALEEHYLINSRPWCPACAQPHLPQSSALMVGDLQSALKLLGAVFLAGLVFMILPGFIPKVVGAALVAVLYFRFVVFKGFGESKTNIERVRQGRRSEV